MLRELCAEGGRRGSGNTATRKQRLCVRLPLRDPPAEASDGAAGCGLQLGGSPGEEAREVCSPWAGHGAVDQAAESRG